MDELNFIGSILLGAYHDLAEWGNYPSEKGKRKIITRL